MLGPEEQGLELITCTVTQDLMFFKCAYDVSWADLAQNLITNSGILPSWPPFALCSFAAAHQPHGSTSSLMKTYPQEGQDKNHSG